MIRRETSPALLGSLLLHVTFAALLLISWNFTRDLKVGSVVPVTIVSKAPPSDVRPAEQAPVEQTAATEEPVPTAPMLSTPPAPQPKPTPLPPKPVPEPKLAKPVPTPTPTKPAPPAKPEKSLDLDALSASISKMAKPAPPKPSSAAKGPARSETAPLPRPALGTAELAAASSGLTDELQKRWHLNCDVEGAREVVVKALFILGASGQVVGQPTAKVLSVRNAVSEAGAESAVRAVFAASGSPSFRSLPRDFYGQTISVTFSAPEACAHR